MTHVTFIMEDITIVADIVSATTVELTVTNAKESASKTVLANTEAFGAALALAIAGCDVPVVGEGLYELAEPLMQSLDVDGDSSALRFIP